MLYVILIMVGGNMINLKAAKCPQCGADIEVNPELERGICQFCGSTILIEDAIEKIQVEHTGTVKIDGIQGENDLIEIAKKHMQFNETNKALNVIEEVLQLNAYNLDALYLYLQIHKEELSFRAYLDAKEFPEEFRSNKIPSYYNTFKTRLNYLKQLDKENKYPTKEYYDILNKIDHEIDEVAKKDAEESEKEYKKYKTKEAIKVWTIRVIRFVIFPIIAFALIYFDEDRNEIEFKLQIGLMVFIYAVEYLLTRRLFNWILDI